MEARADEHLNGNVGAHVHRHIVGIHEGWHGAGQLVATHIKHLLVHTVCWLLYPSHPHRKHRALAKRAQYTRPYAVPSRRTVHLHGASEPRSMEAQRAASQKLRAADEQYHTIMHVLFLNPVGLIVYLGLRSQGSPLVLIFRSSELLQPLNAQRIDLRLRPGPASQ